MKKKSLLTNQEKIINIKQLLIGVIFLFIGTLVYLVDRPAEQTYFIFNTGIDISFFSGSKKLFGLIGNNFPSFSHVFSFSLITAGLFSLKNKGYLAICICWFTVDSMFELGQKFKSFPLIFIPDWFAGIPYLENSKNYFLFGTFDSIDIAANAIGAIAAYIVLVITTERNTD